MQRKQGKRKSVKKESTACSWQIALLGLLWACGCTALGVLGVAGLFYAGWLSTGAGQYQVAAYAVMGVSLLIGLLYAWRKIEKKERIWLFAVPGGYFLIRLVMGALLTAM